MRAASARFGLGALKAAVLGLGLLATFALVSYLAGFALLQAQTAGIEPTSFAVLAGSLFVAGTLALRPLLADLAAGLILLLGGSVRTGDCIETEGEKGLLTRIGMRSSWLATVDGQRLSIPNSRLLYRPVRNATHASGLTSGLAVGSTAIALHFVVAARTNPENAAAALERAALNADLIVPQPPPRVALVDSGPVGLEFVLIAHVAKAADAGPAEDGLRRRVLAHFMQAGIEIPNPQHDIHLRDLDVVKVLLARLIQERAQAEPGNEPAGGPGA